MVIGVDTIVQHRCGMPQIDSTEDLGEAGTARNMTAVPLNLHPTVPEL